MAQVIAVYSESGGVTKTTTALSLAVCSALMGHRVVVVDLDPRAALTKWVGVEPAESGLHVGAILADPEPSGWVEELARPVGWPELGGRYSPAGLRVVPSDRELSLREKNVEDYSDIRLKTALEDVAADIVILDCPNRQGGPIIQNALTAADKVVYATKADEDGLDGIDGARLSVQKFKDYRRKNGAPATLQESGIVVGMVREVVTRFPLDTRRAIEVMQESYGSLVLDPVIPDRIIVKEARSAGQYFGFYSKGKPVHDAYMAVTEKVIR